MAVPRLAPYIWASWLAKVMAGETSCLWSPWFRTHNRLIDRHGGPPDLVEWTMMHARMLTDLTRDLARPGLRLYRERRFQIANPAYQTIVTGSIDLVAEEPGEVTVYDCKTGQPAASHEVQVMLYMYALERDPGTAGKSIRGAVIYKHSRRDIPYLSNSFASNFDYFARLLAGTDEMPKAPGRDCAFCPILREDCPERVEE